MRGLPEDIEMMVRFLGHDGPGVQRLLNAYQRAPDMADTVRTLLKRRCRRAGFDPDDPPVFWPVRELPAGLMTMGSVVQGCGPGPSFSLARGLLPQHVGVFGHNGTGKSYLAMHLGISAIRAGMKVWVLDIEDEYSRLVPMLPEGVLTPIDPSQLRFSLFQPPGPWMSPSNWMGEVNLLLRGGTFLRDGSLNIFQAGMANLLGKKGIGSGTEDWPSLSEGIEHFQGMSFGAKSRSAGFIESLLNRLMMLSEAFSTTSNVGASDMLPALAGRSVVFRLHGMTGVPLQFLAGFLLLWLARYREGADAGEGHMVIIEEAHMLSSDKMRQDIGEGILCRMFRTARKRSIALVLCDQVPSEMPQPILANLGCRIVMRLVGARCIWAMQS